MISRRRCCAAGLALLAPVPPAAAWSDDDVRRSWSGPGSAAGRAQAGAAPLPHVLVGEAGAQRLLLFDGDRLQRLAELPLRHALTGTPVLSADRRHAWVASAAGWIERIDLVRGRADAAVRAGSALGDLALSGDDRWLLVASDKPRRLLLFDATLQLHRSWSPPAVGGGGAAGVGTIAVAPARRSFIVSWRDRRELWEISYDERAEDIFEGLVHDYRMGEGLPMRGFLNPRRTPLGAPLNALTLDIDGTQVLGEVGGEVQVYNLDARRRVRTAGSLSTPGPGAGAAYRVDGDAAAHLRSRADRAERLALPRRDGAVLQVLETDGWQPVADVALPGRGRAARTHAGCPLVWADSARDPAHADRLTGVDRRSLQPRAVVTLRGPLAPPPCFGPGGHDLWLSVNNAGGMIQVLDATSGQEEGAWPAVWPAALGRSLGGG